MLGSESLLNALLFLSLTFAALGTTAFPVLYSRYPWRRSAVGKALMVRSVAFAVAVDATWIFLIWTPRNIELLKMLNILIFFVLGASNFGLTLVMQRVNQENEKEKDRDLI